MFLRGLRFAGVEVVMVVLLFACLFTCVHVFSFVVFLSKSHSEYQVSFHDSVKNKNKKNV